VPRQQAPGAAVGERDRGVRKVTSLTWRAGAAGIACSALIGAALAYHAEASPAPASTVPARPHHSPSGQIVVPAQPPQPATGSGQVSSGAS
jgi:hypothetical protein